MKRLEKSDSKIKYSLYSLIIISILFISLNLAVVYMGQEFTFSEAIIGSIIILFGLLYLYKTLIDISLKDLKEQVLSALILSAVAVSLSIYSAFTEFNRGAVSLIVFLVLVLVVRGLFTFRKHIKAS